METESSGATAPGAWIGEDGAGWRHPFVCWALHRVASITEMSLSTSFAVYRVCVWLSRMTCSGSGPAWMVGGLRVAHAARWRPLHSLVSTTTSGASF